MSAPDAILVKIKKLLAMAQDASSPYEAAIAMKMARRLMDEYQISEIVLENSAAGTGFAEQHSGAIYARMPVWQQSIALAIGQLNDCMVAKVLIPNTRQYQICFKGFQADVTTASLMYEALIQQAERLSADYRDRQAKQAFLSGFAQGLSDQLARIYQERQKIKMTSGKSLVLAKKQLVEQQFGRTRTRTQKHQRAQFSPFFTGYAAGKHTALETRVNHSKKKVLSFLK